MSTAAPVPAGPDPTILVNLLENANPLAQVVIHTLQRAAGGAVDLRLCRLRDAWLGGEFLPAFHLLVQLGGDLRGGANGALWNRMRAHPWYLSDADTEIPEHARVSFVIRDDAVAQAAARLVDKAPAVAVSPEQKLRDSIDRQLKRADARYPATVPAAAVQRLMVAFVNACIATAAA